MLREQRSRSRIRASGRQRQDERHLHLSHAAKESVSKQPKRAGYCLIPTKPSQHVPHRTSSPKTGRLAAYMYRQTQWWWGWLRKLASVPTKQDRNEADTLTTSHNIKSPTVGGKKKQTWKHMYVIITNSQKTVDGGDDYQWTTAPPCSNTAQASQLPCMSCNITDKDDHTCEYHTKS
jgi:hypothetical protein